MNNGFVDIEVHQQASQLVKDVYLLTRKFPKKKAYELMNQMRKIAVFIESNIVEGETRQTKNEIVQYLNTALKSTSELETQVAVSKKLNHIDENEEAFLLAEIGHVARMIKDLTLAGSKIYAPQTVN